jgi:hypothetical protein
MRPLIKFGGWVFLLCGMISSILFGFNWSPASAQQSSDATPTGTVVGPFITVTYIEPINVRAGPSSYDYPIIGSIPVGGTAAAIGRSPKGEWIQIEFSGGPRNTGWVYAANVSLSVGANLPIAEPPPTAVPAENPTINPTFVAQLQAVPTATRLPTFTPPPPLQIPNYMNSSVAGNDHFHWGWVAVTLGLIGIFGMIVSSVRRR